jgi:outer membrane receptor protein involved in Fe transport
LPSGTPGAGHAASLPERKDTAFSPKAAALYRFTDRISVWGSIGAGFRAPTLNELYRQFRVGPRLTLANNQLGPERLKSGELGVRVSPVARMTWRATWFDNRMTDPVSNVTITPPNTLQRKNLGATRIAGVQHDVEYQIDRSWSVSAAYLYNRAKVTENPSNTALVGLYLPQVPKHRGSVEVTYANPRWFTANLLVQASGRQFDDDRNVLSIPGYSTPGLPKYGVVSFSISRQVTHNFEVFAAAQNLLDQQYFVGTGPSLVGSPRIASVGIRVRVSGQ